MSIKMRYERDGLTIQEIADETGVSLATAYRRLDALGVDFRHRARFDWTRENVIVALREWALRHGGFAPTRRDLTSANELPSQTTLGRIFGKRAVSAAANAAGLPQRPHARRSFQVQPHRNRRMITGGLRGAKERGCV